jgi:hypothetical protein
LLIKHLFLCRSRDRPGWLVATITILC